MTTPSGRLWARSRSSCSGIPSKRPDLLVDRHVVLAVDAHELVGLVLVELPHLRVHPVASDVRHQHLVRDLPSEHGARRMPEGGEDQRPGVDQGAVEVEEDGLEAHTARDRNGQAEPPGPGGSS